MTLERSSAVYGRGAANWCRAQGSVEAYGSEDFAGRRLFFGSAGQQAEAGRAGELASMLSYLKFLIWAEQGVVTEVSQMIETGKPYDFAPDLKAGAGSVRRQEAEHSRRAYRLLVSLERAEGHVCDWETPACGLVLDALIDEHPDHAALAKLLLVIFAEVVDFQTATRLIGEPDLAEPVREFARFHENEEILHRVYFRKLLEELIPKLSEEEGRFAAHAIHELLRSFVLERAELVADPAETWPTVRAKCAQAIHYLHNTGFLSDPERKRRFEGMTA